MGHCGRSGEPLPRNQSYNARIAAPVGAFSHTMLSYLFAPPKMKEKLSKTKNSDGIRWFVHRLRPTLGIIIRSPVFFELIPDKNLSVFRNISRR